MTGGENGGPPRFTLDAPLEPPYIATARMFAASVARQFEMAEDLIEDLKLAVSEACSRALAAGGRDGRLEITVEPRGSRLSFEIVQGKGAAPPEEDSGAEEVAPGFHLELIAALFDDAETVPGPDGNEVIRFSAA